MARADTVDCNISVMFSSDYVSSTKNGLQLGSLGDTLASAPADEERAYHRLPQLIPCLTAARKPCVKRDHSCLEPSPRPFSFLGTPQGRN